MKQRVSKADISRNTSEGVSCSFVTQPKLAGLRTLHVTCSHPRAVKEGQVFVNKTGARVGRGLAWQQEDLAACPHWQVHCLTLDK